MVHLSELSQKAVNNPNEVVRIGQKVKVKLILIDPKNRKIGLSMKDLDENKESAKAEKKADLADIADKLEKEEAEKKATRKPRAKKAEAEEETAE
ncbi:S1 RNA-binding domain-containing protein [bacterium]|nr:S1 RNA-binding domain-containing protein [bacterium]